MTDQSSSSHEANASLFPHRLYEMLDDCEKQGKSHIVSWLPDGKAFKVHQVPEFVGTILPRYFRQSKYKSYQRQLNLWGFERVTSSGPEKGAYYHGHFLKGKYAMVKLLTRQRGNKTADSSVHSSPKPTKPKLQKAKRNTVTKQSKDQMFTKSFDFEAKTCRQHTDGTTSCVRNENQVSMAGEHSVASQQNYEQAIDSQASAILAERKLFFEGCEFFPLEEERYDELEELILQAGTDILNWPRTQQDPEQSISGSRALSFGLLPPPSQLCRV